MHSPRARFFLFLSIFVFFTTANFLPLGELFPSLAGVYVDYEIEKGTGGFAFATNIFKRGLFGDEAMLRTIMLILNGVKYGTYRCELSMSPLENILNAVTGREFIRQRRITIIEGSNVFDVALQFQSKGFFSADEFFLEMNELLAQDNFREKYLISPSAKDLEGYLFPDTYDFLLSASPRDVIEKFLSRFKDIITTLAPAMDRELLHDNLIKASLIEKETGVGEEELIASVINNRLSLRMRLQIDASILYGLLRAGIKTNNITKKNKYHRSPYNTYVNYGLPKNPICSPGKKCIRAALLPIETTYLYYVSKNDGTHDFSVTYSDHRKKVGKYQKK